MDECQQVINKLKGEISLLTTTISRLSDKKIMLNDQLKIAEISLSELTQINHWNEFVEGKRKGYLWEDPWTYQECTFCESSPKESTFTSGGITFIPNDNNFNVKIGDRSYTIEKKIIHINQLIIHIFYLRLDKRSDESDQALTSFVFIII